MLVKADLKINQDKLEFVCHIVAINKKIATQSLLSYQSARHTMNGGEVNGKQQTANKFKINSLKEIKLIS